jgi:peptide/nickel transport system ATP-binding protein
VTPLLEVCDLVVEYPTEDGFVQAVAKTSFTLGRGTKLGVVGESGSGKTTTALALMRMIRAPGRIAAGEAWLDGVNLLALSADEMRRARLRDVAYIPQGAMNSLSPVRTVGRQIEDAIEAHRPGTAKADVQQLVRVALQGVNLDPVVAGLYPHELSGGMKQRVCIAIGTVLGPKLLIADEPTSALDVVTQRQVMETLDLARRKHDSGLILIGHDMGLMAQFVDQLAVMYAGRLVEFGSIVDLMTRPRHPYTRALVSAVPTLSNRGQLISLPGVTPSLARLPAGCAFAPRCGQVMHQCRIDRPAMVATDAAHAVACHLHSPHRSDDAQPA